MLTCAGGHFYLSDSSSLLSFSADDLLIHFQSNLVSCLATSADRCNLNSSNRQSRRAFNEQVSFKKQPLVSCLVYLKSVEIQKSPIELDVVVAVSVIITLYKYLGCLFVFFLFFSLNFFSLNFFYFSFFLMQTPTSKQLTMQVVV